MDQQQITFYNNYHSLADQASANLKISPYIVLAQWALESGWGSASYVPSTHNLAGIMKTSRVVQSFVSFEQFLSAYTASMRNDCPVIKGGKSTPQMTASEVFAGTDYNTANPNYAVTIQNIADTISSYVASLHPSQPSQPSQTLVLLEEAMMTLSKLKNLL